MDQQLNLAMDDTINSDTEESDVLHGGFAASATPVDSWLKWSRPNKAAGDLAEGHLRPKVLLRSSSATGSHSTPVLTLEELGSVQYLHFRVKIFRRSGRYFYEPPVLLDPTSIVSRSDQVRFNIRMWDADLEEKVNNWLKRFQPNLTATEGINVQVLDYQELRLVTKTSHPSTLTAFQLPEQSISYHQLDQNVQFRLLCDSAETADRLAEELRVDLDTLTQHLALECRISSSNLDGNSRKLSTVLGLKIAQHQPEAAKSEGSSVVLKRILDGSYWRQLMLILTAFLVLFACYNWVTADVQSGSFQQRVVAIEKEFQSLRKESNLLKSSLQDFKLDLNGVLKSRKASASIVPVFTASCATQTRAGNFVTFDEQCVDTNAAHKGSFNGSTGLLTVTIPGVYLVLFNGMGNHNCSITLRVNMVEMASSGYQPVKGSMSDDSSFAGPVSISALLPLKNGDQVGAFITDGFIFDEDQISTRISVILFPF